ncbi:conserved hypothetical protein [Candidatus Terasakiella magnetica]|nr:conserved hypothetical protein [Candidatus Terasakiella magnetica]
MPDRSISSGPAFTPSPLGGGDEAPTPEGFASLLDKVLADLPPSPPPLPSREAVAAPQGGLLQRIFGRRRARMEERRDSVPDMPDTDGDEDDDVLLLDDADLAPPEPVDVVIPEAVPDMPDTDGDEDDDDVLLLDDADLAPPEPVDVVIPEAAPEMPDTDGDEDDDDDVLLLDDADLAPPEPVDVVIPEAAPEMPDTDGDEDDDDDVLLLDDADLAPPEPVDVVIPEAAPEMPDTDGDEDDDDDVLLLDDADLAPPEPVDVVIPEAVPEMPDTDGDEDDDVLLLDDADLTPPEPVPSDAHLTAIAPAPEPTPGDDVPEELHWPPEGIPALLDHSADQVLFQQVLDALARQQSAAAAPPADTPDTASLLQQVLAALTPPCAPEAPPPPPCAPAAPAPAPIPDALPASGEEDGDILLLDDGFVVPTPRSGPMTAEEMRDLIAAATPDTAGSLEIPDTLESLAALLLSPADDFQALDLLAACWPRCSGNVSSRALLAVAINLARNFGLPGKLPLAATKAWRMLHPQIFQDALAQRLASIAEFVFSWQRSQYTFLSLDHGEIELVEYLFEALHPGKHAELLVSVMNFKVLSGRRMGLVRRIPVHARRIVDMQAKIGADMVLVNLGHYQALLTLLLDRVNFPPILEAAHRAQTEVDKLAKQAAQPPPPVSPASTGLGIIPVSRIAGREKPS